jgi:peptide-methionine (S)-S-oxide reductase
MNLESIVLAGGCFWCTEAVFKQIRGVQAVESGYANGHVANPSYEHVCSGDTGHAEVVRVDFDPSVVSLEKLLEVFFHTHDPTTLNRQGADVGTQYRSGIYFSNPVQEELAKSMVNQFNRDQLFGKTVVTEIQPLENYFPAENYHQNYFEQHPNQGYCAWVVGPKVEKFRKTFHELLKN